MPLCFDFSNIFIQISRVADHYINLKIVPRFNMSCDMEVDETNSVEDNRLSGTKLRNFSVVPVISSNASLNLEEQWFNAQERLRSNINLLNSSTDQSEEKNHMLCFLEEVINTINNSLKTLSCASPIFSELIQSLIELLKYKNIDKKICLNTVKTIVVLHNRNIYHLSPKNYVTVICFLLENCCQNQGDKTLTPFLKDLRKLLINIRNDDISSAFLEEKSKITNVLNIILGRIQFCCTAIGIDVIACIVSLNEDFRKTVQENVRRLLVSCKKNEAAHFGKLYHRIWELLEDEKQKSFEENYIQWLMDRAFTLDRTKPPVRCLFQNLLSFLQALHDCRQKTKFSRVITELYSPIIWKYLNSNNNIHRYNAAEIFISVYPLERTGRSMKEYSIFLRKQHEELLALFDDPCPAVRIIAIKGACTNLRYFWVTFQNGTVEKIIEKFITDLVTDGSSSDVRKAVYQGLTQLLHCEESHPLLKGVLPSLGSFIHDENQNVRHAFISMLIELKKLHCEIKYWHIVDIRNFALRLANDVPKNRELIVKLIFSSFFNEKIKPEESYKRLCKFISVNPSAIRYLAMYSKGELKFADAINIMCLILKIMAQHVMKKMQTLVDENHESEETNASKSKASQKVLSNAENITIENKENIDTGNSSVASVVSVTSELNRSTNLFDPRISHGLLDYVTMLWLCHGKTLHREENKDLLEKLRNSAVKCIPFVLRLFKGTHAYYGALNLASLLPLSRIGHLATVISGSVSMLRHMSPDAPDNEVQCLIHVLCSWNRGDKVIGLAKEWLDETFRAQALNESYVLEEKKRQKRVRFPRSEPKPVFALRILNELFASPSNQTRIFTSETSELRSLLTFLSRTKVIIDRRIEKGSVLSELLSDDVLVDALTLYGNLIIMFKENNVEGFNFWRKFTDYLEWCNGIVVRCCSVMVDHEETFEDLFVSKVLHVPLMQCINLIAIGKCDDEQLIILLKFCKSTLDSDSGLQFVEISVHLLKQLILFSRVHHADKRLTEVMYYWFPCIMDKLLTLLTDRMYSKDVLSSCIKDITDLKRNMVYIYILAGKLYPELKHATPCFKIMSSFCQALINVILFPITECETLNVDQNLKNLPFIGSFLASIFMSQFDLGSALLFVLKTIIDRFTEKDGLLLLATTSLLYTFAFSDSKIPKPEVLKIVKITYEKLQNLPAEEGHVALVMNREQTIADRTIIDIEEATESAVKEVGQHILKKITEHLGGSLS